MLARCGVPEKYGHAVVEKCMARAALQQYLDRLPAEIASGSTLILHGNPGTGKSSAAGVICRESLKAGFSVAWFATADLIDALASYEHRKQAMARAGRMDLVVLDDFGVGGLGDREIGLLDRVVELRYQRTKATVVTTNYSLKTLAAPELSRIMDRWRERPRKIALVGESMRGRD